MCEDPRETLFLISNIKEIISTSLLERSLSTMLNLAPERVSVVTDVEDGECQFIVFPEDESPQDVDGEALSEKLNELQNNFHCAVIDVDEEEEESIDEETALKLWREQTDRTSHLPPFPSPDGEMIAPSHDTPFNASTTATADTPVSPTEYQLRRDPTLLTFDNVERIHVDDPRIKLKETWEIPFVITGISAASEVRA